MLEGLAGRKAPQLKDSSTVIFVARDAAESHTPQGDTQSRCGHHQKLLHSMHAALRTAKCICVNAPATVMLVTSQWV